MSRVSKLKSIFNNVCLSDDGLTPHELSMQLGIPIPVINTVLKKLASEKKLVEMNSTRSVTHVTQKGMKIRSRYKVWVEAKPPYFSSYL